MATRLFVGNLPENTEENDLRGAFSCYGEITNLDLKSKSAAANEGKKFAFVSISGSNYNIESCIKHFSNEDFNGNRIYVTRARESFLERLQRERLEAQQKLTVKSEVQEPPKKTPVIKLGDKLNPRKRKLDIDTSKSHKPSPVEHSKPYKNEIAVQNGDFKQSSNGLEIDKKKLDSEMKRIEAMKKRRQEFREKQMILKSGLTGVDKVLNKKVIFSDNEEDTQRQVHGHVKNSSKSNKKNTLFDENDDSGDEVNFEIKKQFEGKKGQKVLDLQSRYKSDKRFVLDERFIEDDEGEGGKDQEIGEEDQIEVNQTDEKAKQINILQDVLGVEIKRNYHDGERNSTKNKPKIGMLRFDPSQPEHAKFLAPIEEKKQESTKKSKKKTKDKQPEEIQEQESRPEEPRPEVSKEQFYKVSDTLREAIAQPTSFSLRSLFGNNYVNVDESKSQEDNYIPLEKTKKSKVKNPLEPGEKNPFVYDSSDSEDDVEKETNTETNLPLATESKAVWKESFFFHQNDQRFEEGLAFFTSANETVCKERRNLKSLMKKRIHNKDRKDQMQMFKKKIGGRKKTMKKSFRRKN